MPELTAVLLALKLRYFFEFYVRLFGHSSLEEKKKKKDKKSQDKENVTVKPQKMGQENLCEMREIFLDSLYFRFIIFFQVMGSLFLHRCSV